jgi:predicted nucleic acid-binding protein
LIFVDTTIWASAIDASDTLHDDGSAVLKALADGELPSAVTTDFVLDETLTLLKMRGGRPDAIARAIASIMSSRNLNLVYVDDALFDAALRTYQKFERLSFTDAVTLAVMQQRKIKEIFSHDEDFDIKGILRRERPG